MELNAVQSQVSILTLNIMLKRKLLMKKLKMVRPEELLHRSCESDNWLQ